MLWVGETCSHSEHVFPKLLTPNSENFGETCSESEKRALSRRNVFSLRTRFSKTPNSQLRKFRRNVFWVGETCSESAKRALSQRNVFSLRTRFSKTPNSQLQKFRRNVFWVGETCSRRNVLRVRETCSHSEHVFPKLLTPNSEEFWVGETCSESEKRALSQRNVFSLRTRFSKTPNSQLRKFCRNVFWVGETCCESKTPNS